MSTCRVLGVAWCDVRQEVTLTFLGRHGGALNVGVVVDICTFAVWLADAFSGLQGRLDFGNRQNFACPRNVKKLQSLGTWNSDAAHFQLGRLAETRLGCLAGRSSRALDTDLPASKLWGSPPANMRRSFSPSAADSPPRCTVPLPRITIQNDSRSGSVSVAVAAFGASVRILKRSSDWQSWPSAVG